MLSLHRIVSHVRPCIMCCCYLIYGQCKSADFMCLSVKILRQGNFCKETFSSRVPVFSLFYELSVLNDTYAKAGMTSSCMIINVIISHISFYLHHGKNP